MTRTLNFDRYRNKLQTLRRHLDEHDVMPSADAIDGYDSVDLANHQTEASVAIGLAEHDAASRHEIDPALARIDAGTFGICEKCLGPSAFVASTRFRMSASAFAANVTSSRK